MPHSLEQFRERIKGDSEAELRQRLENARASSKYAEHAVIVKRELDTRYPGWDKPRTHRGGSHRTIARFRGDEQVFATARAAYIWLVECFASAKPDLFSNIRWETTGYFAVGRRKSPDGAARNYFARTPAKLFLRTPTLADSSSNYHQLSNGWYVNLNLNTRENFEILCRFAYVSKLAHQVDWDWEVVDPSEPLHDLRARVLLASELMRKLGEL
jgi:hypothetical protein